jgi:hypothetical protein
MFLTFYWWMLSIIFTGNSNNFHVIWKFVVKLIVQLVQSLHRLDIFWLSVPVTKDSRDLNVIA